MLCARCQLLILDPVMLLQPDPGKCVHLPVNRYRNRVLKGPDLPLRWLSKCGQQGFLYLNAPILEERRLCTDCKRAAIASVYSRS